MQVLSHMTSLMELNLDQTSIDGTGLAAAAGLSRMESLSLLGCHDITLPGMITLGQLSHLTDIDLSCTHLGGAELQALTSLSNLKNLMMRYCRLEQVRHRSTAVLWDRVYDSTLRQGLRQYFGAVLLGQDSA
jgi:hypothetical protein